MNYYLMHKDFNVALLNIDELGQVTSIDKINDMKRLPLGGNLNEKDLKKWWSQRPTPMTQDGFIRHLKMQNVDTSSEFLVKNLGLSLNDCYWIKPYKSNIQWKNVNLFNTLISSKVGKNTNPNSNYDATTKGQLYKEWQVENQEIYLIKGNKGNSCQQSINEILATKIHTLQEWRQYTIYSLCNINYKGNSNIGCKCKLFCNEDIEFIPAISVFKSNSKISSLDFEKEFIITCTNNGLNYNEVKHFLDYQILTDFIITNEDRHTGNFGVLRNSNSLEFIGMANIFDSGNSMYWDRNDALPQNRKEIGSKVINSFKIKEKGLLETVDNYNLVDINKLPKADELKELYNIDAYTDSKHYDKIINIYNTKIEMLQELQQNREAIKTIFEDKIII